MRASTWSSCRATAAATSQTPSTINYRANIDALKRSGVTDVISVSACGSLKEELPPGTFRDRRPVHRPHLCARKSFFRAGIRGACPDGPSGLSPVDRGARGCGRARRHPPRQGRHLYLHGRPAILHLAESNLYRSWGCSVIGMTAMPEAKLAREAELPYAVVAMVTDYDCWHPTTTKSRWMR